MFRSAFRGLSLRRIRHSGSVVCKRASITTSSCYYYSSSVLPASGHPRLLSWKAATRNFSAETTTTPNSDEKSLYGSAKHLPKHGQLEHDFFGEPVTFLGLHEGDTVTNAMAALDGWLLGAVSKGLTCFGGGDEGGLAMQAAHSVAISWSECLRHAVVWNQNGDDDDDDKTLIKSAPMLAVITVAPVLAQAGIAYVKHLDALLEHAKPGAPGLPVLQMHEIAVTAASHKDDEHLNLRERMHLEALDYLLQNDYPTALTVYLTILSQCPGDALAMSQAMDLCWVLGDKESGLR